MFDSPLETKPKFIAATRQLHFYWGVWSNKKISHSSTFHMPLLLLSILRPVMSTLTHRLPNERSQLKTLNERNAHMHWRSKRLSKGKVIHCNRQWYYITDIFSPSRCAPGYYGNPMAIGNSCKRCDCNGNSDPNLIFNECHNVTGHCQHCWGNTAGANCERCAPGFYGDAITDKNCRGADEERTPLSLIFIQEMFNPSCSGWLTATAVQHSTRSM